MKKILTILPILLILVQTGCEEKAAATEKTNSAKETKIEIVKGPAKVTETAPVWNGKPNTNWFKASETEFTINSAEDLAGLISLAKQNNGLAGKTFKLGKNIMLNDTADWQDWATKAPKFKWMPIATFAGTFDGNGCAISGIYINDWASNDQGLFGAVSGQIKNMSIEASYVRGSSNVGGLAGLNTGNISNSYYSGIVAGVKGVGGLVGLNEGSVSNSFSKAMVNGSDRVGGLAGISKGAMSTSYSVGAKFTGIISNSYSVGKVTGKTNVGGLVGENSESKILNSYYNKETSEQSDKGKGEAKSTTEMQSKEFVNNANAISGLLELNAWIYEEGKYPAFSINAIKAASSISSFFESGNGTRAKPYVISTKKHLEDFAMLVNTGAHFAGKYIKLGGDIALNDTANWKKWEMEAPSNAWVSIGTLANPFRGTFDGDGHVISGVYINSASNNEGLFGCLDSDAAVKNIEVAGSYIKGARFVGGLVGIRYAQTQKHYLYGDLVEVKSKGKISNSSYTGEVKGTSNTGKLFGGEKQYSQHEQ